MRAVCDLEEVLLSQLINFMVVAVICSAPLRASIAVTVQSGQPKTLIIDGSKNPELFPQWFAWETFFQSWPMEYGRRATLLRQELGLSDQEVAYLQTEVKRFRDAEGRLKRELRSTRVDLLARGKSEDQIRDATKEINLRYRHEVLDGRGRVFATLKPESFKRVVEWIDGRLKGTTIRLRGRTLEYFQQPW